MDGKKIFIGGMIFAILVLPSGCVTSPEITGEEISIKEFTLLTEDGVTISVSHFLYNQPNVCILAHGFMGSKHRPYIKTLSERLSKYSDIITFDFRGHGDSLGVFNGLDEFYDIKAVVEYARNCGYKKIVVVGFSLGGIEGIYEAAKFHNIDALVTVSTPANAEIIEFTAKWLFWLLTNQFGRMVLQPWVRLDNTPEFPKPVTVIDQVSPIPLLIIQGTEDILVDIEQAEILYEKAKEPKDLVILEGMGHPPKLTEEFHDTVEKWLEELLKQ
jgi:esterase/lipase